MTISTLVWFGGKKRKRLEERKGKMTEGSEGNEGLLKMDRERDWSHTMAPGCALRVSARWIFFVCLFISVKPKNPDFASHGRTTLLSKFDLILCTLTVGIWLLKYRFWKLLQGLFSSIFLTRGASDIVKVESCEEDPRVTGGLISNLPHPWVNKTKQHPWVIKLKPHTHSPSGE